MPNDPKERRRHVRRDLARPCKVYHPIARRYAWAEMLNVSRGGALVRVESARGLSPGESIDLAIAWTPTPVIPADSMVHARVAHSTRDAEGRQVVGLEFAQAMALAA